MSKPISNEVPYILTGKVLSKEGLFATIQQWSPKEVTDSIEKVERRYRSRTNHEIGGFSGLQLFCEIVKVLREIPNPTASQADLILKAQKRVLHYHNIQYVGTKEDGKLPDSSDSKLPYKS